MAEKTIGEFELFTDKLIGKGAWGDVYHGRQKSLDRPVAIKILKKDLTQDESFVNRFKRESATLAKMSDDHIVHVYSAGEYEGSYYFIMEYVEGQPLSSFIEQGHKFSTDEIIYVAESVARSLKAAWESSAKIVHRDIKPSNIMVASSGSCIKSPGELSASPKLGIKDINILQSKIKVMDFGLAKVSEGGKDATMAGTVIGTPKYISPEQGLGTAVDIRSDIYSLGIVIYEMATGRIPFDSETAISMIRHHINDTAMVPSKFNPNIPHDLEKIIMKCIHKEPERRYAEPQQLLEDLLAFKQQRPPVYASSAAIEATMISDVTKHKRKARMALYSGVVGGIIVVGVVLYLIIPKTNKPAQQPIQQNVAQTPTQQAVQPPTQQNTDQTPIATAPSSNTAVTLPPPPVTPVPPVPPPTATIIEKPEEFSVKVWTDKEKGYVYKEGDVITLTIKANRDSYVYVFYKDATGHLLMLFPNGYTKDNLVKANQVYSIPTETMRFNIAVSPPFGLEEIKVVASFQKVKEWELEEGETFKDFGIVASIDESKFITRGVNLVPKEARTEDIYIINTTTSTNTTK